LPAEPRWVTTDELATINRQHVPNSFLREAGLLDSAAAAPRNAHVYADEADLVRLAAHLLHAVAMAHAFEDGNKRTAFFGAMLFLELNGCTVALPDTERVGELVTDLVEHKITRDDFAARIAPFIALPA
jgi:death-on-curing protein